MTKVVASEVVPTSCALSTYLHYREAGCFYKKFQRLTGFCEILFAKDLTEKYLHFRQLVNKYSSINNLPVQRFLLGEYKDFFGHIQGVVSWRPACSPTDRSVPAPVRVTVLRKLVR